MHGRHSDCQRHSEPTSLCLPQPICIQLYIVKLEQTADQAFGVHLVGDVGALGRGCGCIGQGMWVLASHNADQLVTCNSTWCKVRFNL